MRRWCSSRCLRVARPVWQQFGSLLIGLSCAIEGLYRSAFLVSWFALTRDRPKRHRDLRALVIADVRQCLLILYSFPVASGPLRGVNSLDDPISSI
jgi:hypothetical protein